MQDLLLFATDPQVIPEDRKQIGMCIVIVMVANIAFAVGIMMTDSIKEIIRQCKMCKKRTLVAKMKMERKAAVAAQAAVPKTPLSIIEEVGEAEEEP